MGGGPEARSDSPYVRALWPSDRLLVVTAIGWSVVVVGVHDVWRAMHAGCLDSRDMREPASIVAVSAQVVATGALATAAWRAFDDVWVERALVGWVIIDLLAHLRLNAWGAVSVVAHAIVLWLVVQTLAERRRALSHETEDRLAVTLGVAVFSLGAVLWAPSMLDGGLHPAHLALLLPLGLAGIGTLRLRARRRWLAGIHQGPEAEQWRVHPLGGVLAEGLLPLASYDGECDAVLARHAPGSAAYRDGGRAIALVSASSRLRPLIPTRSVAAMMLALGAPLVALAAMGAIGADDPLPAMATQTTFDLMSAGEEPRISLRRRVSVGRCEREATDTDETRTTTTELTLGRAFPTTMPRAHVDSTTVVTRILPNGNLRVRSTATSLRTASGSDVPGALRAQVADDLESRAGLEIESEVTPLGETVGSRLRAVPGMKRESTETVQQMRLARRGLGAPFPDLPLGAGARWRAVHSTTEDGITSVGTYQYEVKSVDGSRVTLEKTYEIHAKSDGATLGPEEYFKLRALDVTGRATETIDVEAMIPVSEVTDSDETLSADGRTVSLGVASAPLHLSARSQRRMVRMPSSGGD